MKIVQIFLPFFFTIIFVSCQKKEIKIPTSNNSGIQEVSNFTEIWLFLNVQEKDTLLNLNDNNLITSTNWIFNTDKRFKLKMVIPTIQKFQERRLKKSLHNTDGFNNYLSYSDTISKILSFVDITNIHYHSDSIQSKKAILKKLDYYKNFNNFHLSFGKKYYFINENKIEKVDFFETLIELINFTKTEQKTLLNLNFNQEITYQEYMFIKTSLIHLQKDLFLMDKNEFVFDAEKISECGCNTEKMAIKK